MNSRRKLIIALAALPVGLARAQPAQRAGKTMRVGILSTGTGAATGAGNSKIFIDAMREMGWVEGRNIIYDRVYADNEESRLPVLAAELVARAPDLIWVMTGQPLLAAIASTRTIPIVFATYSNVVEQGLVKSLARPGGNVTGMQTIGRELGGKRLQLLREALPKIARVGVLVLRSPDSTGPQEFKLIEKAAVTLGLTVIPAIAKGVGEFDSAIALLVKNRVEALLVPQNNLFYGERKRILELAASRRLPVAGFRSEFTDDGALMSYGSLLTDQIRRSAQMVDMILKGTKKPADIPVEQPTRFELVVNLKTAKALGITIPGEIMLQATRVIE
jgi:putative ABC transport system substrate-binding protein